MSSPEYHRSYWEKNKEKLRAYRRAHYLANKEKRKQQHKDWIANNPERNKELNREKAKRYRQRNPNAAKTKYATDPVYKLRVKVTARLRHAMRGFCKSESTLALLGCTYDELRVHLEKQFQPGMSWDNRSEWHIDHIRPISSFDFSDPKQQAEACHYTNLQPLWAADNLKKGATFSPVVRP